MLKILVFFTVLLCISSSAFCSGLNNSTKEFTPVLDMSHRDWKNPDELERTWRAALVRIPKSNGAFIETTVDYFSSESTSKKKFPTVIYLHGCSGVWEGTFRRINLLAKNGFAVIAPISFARIKYPRSCFVDKKQGGLYPGTLKMRQYDASYAITKAERLSWVDSDNVFLMGLSEGGITTATLLSRNKKTSVNARVIEGWTCHSAWRDYAGIKAPKSQAVLALVGSNDPWFQNHWVRGDCGPYLKKGNGSKSIVFSKEPLMNTHELLEDIEVQDIVIQFLQTHIKE